MFRSVAYHTEELERGRDADALTAMRPLHPTSLDFADFYGVGHLDSVTNGKKIFPAFFLRRSSR